MTKEQFEKIDAVRVRPTQLGGVLDWLLLGYNITALQALQMFGCMRLAPRIIEIKALGVPVDSVMIRVNGRGGKGKSVAEYSIPAEFLVEWVIFAKKSLKALHD